MASYLDDVEKHIEAARVRSKQRKLEEQTQKAKQEAKKAPKKDNSSPSFF